MSNAPETLSGSQAKAITRVVSPELSGRGLAGRPVLRYRTSAATRRRAPGAGP